MDFKSIVNRAIFRFEFPFYLKVYLQALLHSPKKRTNNFVIFSQGRTGSTLLTDLLNNHPNIRCDTEILNVRYHGKKIFPSFYVKSVAKTSKKEIYGFKVKIYQLTDKYNNLHQNVDPEIFLTDLYKSGWKIIYLKRDNLFRQAISNFVAESKGKYHHRNTSEWDSPKIKINPDKLLSSIRGREEHLRHEKEILRTIPHLEVTYETDLLQNREKALNKIFNYLEVQPYPVKSSFSRTSKDELKDYIVNYKDIVDFISKTEYGRFLKY